MASSSTSTVIDLTVKTLESQNHLFRVPEDTLVKDFKGEISSAVGIPPDQQRLIYRGRVLQDQQKLSEYNVANNTLHVVQRPNNAYQKNNDEPSGITEGIGEPDESAAAGSTIIMSTFIIPVEGDVPGDSCGQRMRNTRAANRIQGSSPTRQAPKEQKSSSDGIIPKQQRDRSRSVDANADIDAMLDLESPRRSKPSGDSTAGGDNKIDVAFRNLPTDWKNQAKVDYQRQLGMPKQPPFSTGYTDLFTRK